MFVGNKKILKIVKILVNEIRRGRNENILIVGKSGMGKTTLAKYIAENTGLNYNFCYGNSARIIPELFPLTIIDEVHLAKNFEKFYGHMDSKDSTLIFITTELGDLPEPFINRCFIINIGEYTREQLIEIATYHSKGYLSKDTIEEIVNRSRGIPRVIENLIRRIRAYFIYEGAFPDLINAKAVMDLYGIYEEGYTNDDLNYLKILSEHKHLSLASIQKMLGLPKDTIEKYIEPFLLNKGRIKITNKGREFVR